MPGTERIERFTRKNKSDSRASTVHLTGPDTGILCEAPDEKEAMKMGMRRAEDMDIETFLAIPREDAKKFLEWK